MRIIHFSDFHLIKATVGNSRALIDRMIKALKEVNKESKIDLVVFSGDLVDVGGNGEPISEVFDLFRTEVIVRFELELAIPQSHFLFVGGNHDMLRSNDTEDEDKELDSKLNSISSLANITRSDCTDGYKRTIPFKEYEKAFYSSYIGGTDQLEYCNTLFQSNIKMMINGQRVGVTLLNSSWHSWDSKVDKHRVALGRTQITDSQDFLSDCDVKFSVSHYDISWLKDFEQEDLKTLFAHQYDIVFTGHTHSSAMRAEIEPEGGVFYITAAGTLCANLDQSNTPYANAFLVLDYNNSYKHLHAVKYKQNQYEEFELDSNYENGGVFDRSIAEYSSFVPVSTEFERMFRNRPFIDSQRLQEITKELIDDNNHTLQLVALSGLGKTRLVVEAFRGKNKAHAYYCQYKENNDTSIFKEFEKILASHENDPGLIIIDDCPNKVLSAMISKRDNYGSHFRLIGINNMYFDRESIIGCKQLPFSHYDLESDVNDYIDKHVSVVNNDDYIVQQIKELSGGFPSVAIDLIETYQSGEKVGVDSVESLIPKLLQLDGLSEEKRDKFMTALCTMALFQPVPYGRDDAWNYILMDDDITPFWGKGYPERSSIFANTISRYKGAFIEISGSWLNVRPQPLAVWLVKQWFKNCDNDADRLERLFTSLRGMPDPPQKLILENMAKRMDYMQGNVQAEYLFAELVDINGGPFGNEKVVCSEMGSRLFLSMATVNPSAVARCLLHVFSQKTIKWIFDHVKDDTRRNLMWTLEKLCFAKESFNDGVQVMAMFALAENERYANNSTGQLLQLFHVMLAGTQATLEERLAIIHVFKDLGDAYKDLTLDILKSALQNDHFMRDGGVEKFGFDRREEYLPSHNEILDYWYACRDILLQWAKDDATIWVKMSDIIASYYFRWCANGFAAYILFPLLESIYTIHPEGNDKLYYELRRSDKYVKRRLNDAEKATLSEWEQKFMPKTFVTKLRSERLDVEIDYHKPFEERLRILEGIFSPIVKEFLDNKLYASKKTLLEIIDDKEYFDSNFSYFLIDKSSSEQLEALFDNLVQIAIERNIDVKRGFYSNLYFHAREKSVFNKSIERILEAGLQEQYVALLVLSEKENLTVLRRLRDEQLNKRITIDFIPIYLTRIGLMSDKMFVNVVAAFEPDYSTHANMLLDFVQIHRFGADKEKVSAIIPYVKELILRFDINVANSNDAIGYSRFMGEFVQHIKDEVFIIALNKKIIAAYQDWNLHSKLRDTYTPLLKYHTNEVWEDFVKAFVDSENPSFYLQTKYELGSGSGFGAGPLFQIDETLVKQMCIDYPDEAPHRIAHMAPVFHYNDEKEVDRFSDWFMWLMDCFADRPYVLDGLHGNIHTFSWTGSTIPYYERNMLCFKKLLNHSNPKVVEWAQQNIADCEKELQREKDREEYIRLHYN